ncbi:MAG TPA: alpha-ketoacid dehydrogenase subunit beta [Planctomycetota bacterium]|nr:alpha-ketoacid dehydrogenase subunit beta [Planctomycetota bacterium]
MSEATTAATAATDPITMVDALTRALADEMASDDRVVVLGEDVGVDGGVFRVTKGLRDRFGAQRVVDTPLAEDAIIGTGIGLALGGMRPVCEIQFSGFLHQAFAQFQSHAARYRARTRGQRGLHLVCRAPSGGGIKALEHHSESEEMLYVHTPGMKVVMPSGPRTAYALLRASIRDGDPVLFLEPKPIYRSFREPIVPDETMELGKARIVKPGEDLTLVTYGAMLRMSVGAVERAEAELEASIEVIDLLTLAPYDSATVAESVSRTGRCVVVHEAVKTGGMGAEVIARLNEDCFWALRAPIARVTGWDVPFPLYAREKAFLPDSERIFTAIRETLRSE